MKLLSQTAQRINHLWRTRQLDKLAHILFFHAEDKEELFEQWIKEEGIIIPRDRVNYLIAKARLHYYTTCVA